MSKKAIPLPPEWNNDSLSQFLNDTIKNTLASFVHKQGYFQHMLEVNEIYSTLTKSKSYSITLVIDVFLRRTHSAFLASCKLSMSGHAIETFPQLRSCLEYALYSFYIHKNPSLGSVWINRHKDDQSMKEVRKLFSYSKVIKNLKDHDINLYKKFNKLYQLTIDFGAHPNQKGVSSSLSMWDEGDTTLVRMYYLHDGNSPTLNHSLHRTIEVGVTALLVFQLIYKKAFKDLGLNLYLETLKGHIDSFEK